MTLRRVARPRLLDSHCLLENSKGCFREIALFAYSAVFSICASIWACRILPQINAPRNPQVQTDPLPNTVRESGSRHSRQNNSGHDATDATEAQPQRQVMQCDTQCSSDACADRDR